MSIEVAVIFGSGRRHGNSEAAAEAVLTALLQPGDNVSRFHLCDLTVSHCRSCNTCAGNGGICILNDGMDDIYEAILTADLLLLATPIYFSGPSSLLKQAIDRCQCLWSRRSLDHGGRWGALIMVAGQEKANFRNTVSISRSFLNSIPVQWAGDLSLAGYDEQDDVASSSNALQQAASFGETLGKMIRGLPSP